MKNQVLVLLLLALFTFSCSDNESELQIEDNQAKLALTKSANDIIQSPEFNALVNAQTGKLRSASSKGENSGNGIIVVENPFFTFYGFGTGQGFIFFGVEEKERIKLFPNGTAQVSMSAKDPFCFWFDIFEGSFGNECMEYRTGHLNVNIRGSYFVDEAPWGTFYFITPPFNTSDIFHARNITIDNETQTIDEETGEVLYCNDDATEDRRVSLKIIAKPNNNGDGNGSEITAELKIE